MQLDRWPITRDCILFSIHIVFLVWFAWDAKITLNESIVLVVLYFVYFVILFNNKNMVKVYDRLMARKQVATKRTSYGMWDSCDTNGLTFGCHMLMNLNVCFRPALTAGHCTLDLSGNVHREQVCRWRRTIAGPSVARRPHHLRRSARLPRLHDAPGFVHIENGQHRSRSDRRDANVVVVVRRLREEAQESVESAGGQRAANDVVGVHVADQVSANGDCAESEDVASSVSGDVCHVCAVYRHELVSDCVDDHDYGAYVFGARIGDGTDVFGRWCVHARGDFQCADGAERYVLLPNHFITSHIIVIMLYYEQTLICYSTSSKVCR